LISRAEFTKLVIVSTSREPAAVHGSGSSPQLTPQRSDSPAYRRVLELATRVANLTRRILGPEIEVVWFGSWPRGRAHERSDIDLAIRSRSKLPPESLPRLREAIDELPTLYSIDVVDLAETEGLLREEIERYGRRL
jgi:predicted nucleotidyltransferase